MHQIHFVFISTMAANERVHAEIFSCVSDSGQFIVCTEFGSFPGAIEGIHFELQRPKYFVNLYIV